MGNLADILIRACVYSYNPTRDIQEREIRQRQNHEFEFSVAADLARQVLPSDQGQGKGLVGVMSQ